MKPVLEPVLSHLRMLKVIKYIERYSSPIVLDIGCGKKYWLLNKLKNKIDKGYGIDKHITNQSSKNIKLINYNLEHGIPLRNNEIDVITMLAVLEHLNDPLFILSEINRVLKPGGMILLTVPTIWSQPVLEFLSFKLGIVDPILIQDHKTYYNRQMLTELFSEVEGLFIEEHKYFQCFMNNFVIGLKGN